MNLSGDMLGALLARCIFWLLSEDREWVEPGLDEPGQSKRTTSMRTLMLVSDSIADVFDDMEVSAIDQKEDSSVSLSAGCRWGECKWEVMSMKPLPLEICRCTCLPLMRRRICGGMLDSGSVSGSGSGSAGGKLEDVGRLMSGSRSSREDVESSRASSNEGIALGDIIRVRLDLRGVVLVGSVVRGPAARSSWGEVGRPSISPALRLRRGMSLQVV